MRGNVYLPALSAIAPWWMHASSALPVSFWHFGLTPPYCVVRLDQHRSRCPAAPASHDARAYS
jgi:hypothetical protein